MGNLKPGATVIYESPDNGETVYARYSGESARWLVGHSTKAKSRLDDQYQDEFWGEIRHAAKTNPALQEVLERAIIIYELSKNNG